MSYQPKTLFATVVPTVILEPTPPSNLAKIEPSKSLTKLDDQQIVMFGQEPQKRIGAALDELLVEITKGNSPVLFELFSKLQKGIKDANLEELQKDIEESTQKGMVRSFFESIKLTSAADRIQRVNEKISGMLTLKSKSLVDLTKEMEADIQREVHKLIDDSQRMTKLAVEYRRNIEEFGLAIQEGKTLLSNTEIELQQLKEKAAAGNPLDIENEKRLEQRIDLFNNRLLVLENAYQEAFAQIESIRLSQGASLTVLAETASSSFAEFSSIKSSLIKLAVSLQIKVVAATNDERRKLRNSLQTYGNNMLEQTAIAAAESQGNNRLEDAKNLLDNAQKLNNISSRVLQERENNKLKFAEARQKLEQTRKLIS